MRGHEESEMIEFEYNLNKMQGWGLLSLIVLNVFPGLTIDFMRTKMSKPYDPDFGAAIGLALSMTISTTLLVSLNIMILTKSVKMGLLGKTFRNVLINRIFRLSKAS